MLPIKAGFLVEIILRAPIIPGMQWELTKTQRAHILAGIADINYRTVLSYFDGEDVTRRKRERIEFAERTWLQVIADHEEACARRKLALVDTSDSAKGTDHGDE